MSARAPRSCEDDVLVGIGSEIPVGRVRRREDAAPPRIQIASDQHDAVLRPAGHEGDRRLAAEHGRSEEHTSELQSLMRISYAVFCLKKKNKNHTQDTKGNSTHTQL